MSEFCGTPMDQLKQLMARLRHPTQGCPWDKEQTFETVAPYTIEEAYEVEDAIARKDSNAIFGINLATTKLDSRLGIMPSGIATSAISMPT
mgnify:CR=1 FL=1